MNVKPTTTLRELLDLMKRTGHSTAAVTEDRSNIGRFVGITLKEANHLLNKHKKEALPILEADGRLNSLVFKKDFPP